MSFSNNIFALLDNEDGGAPSAGKKAAAKKPAAAAASNANGKTIPVGSFPGEQPAGGAKKHSTRTPDRAKDTHVTAGGARGGRGGARGGRGGRTGSEDPSVRQFDRRGAPQRHAPRHAHRDGAALGPEGGAAGVISQGETVAEAVAPEAVVEDVVAVEAVEEVDPEDDGSQTYDMFLAQRAAKAVEDDANIVIREVIIDETQFVKVKPLVRADAEEKAAAAAAEEERVAKKKAAKAQRSAAQLNLDEFRGGREGDAKYGRPQSAAFGGRGGFAGEGFRGGRGGAEGGRGGRGGRGGSFTARPAAAAGADGAAAPVEGSAAAGRGGFQPRRDGGAPRGGARGGRGGAFVPRGGRGGFQQGPRSSAPVVALKDERAFPALA